MTIQRAATITQPAVRHPSQKQVADHFIADALSLLLPCFMFLDVDIIGHLFVPEIALLVLLPLLALSRGRTLAAPIPKWIIILGLCWLTGQCVTDLIHATPFEDYSRGWSKIAFTLCNFTALFLLLGVNRRRLLLFAIGRTAGQFFYLLYDPDPIVSSDPWKFGYGIPVTVVVVLISMTPLFARYKIWRVGALMLMACVHLAANARSLAGICFTAAIYLLIQAYAARKGSRMPSVWARCLVFASLALSAVFLANVYSYFASSGALGKYAAAKYETQSSGDYGILLGGRSETYVATQAIINSPILGHGSWAKDRHYIDLLRNLKDLGYKTGGMAAAYDLGAIPTHSHLLGAWVEAGITGAVFWFFVLWLLWDVLARLCFFQEPLTPLISFFGMTFAWDILFSPFGADRRISDAYIIILLIFARTVMAAQSRRMAAGSGHHAGERMMPHRGARLALLNGHAPQHPEDSKPPKAVH